MIKNKGGFLRHPYKFFQLLLDSRQILSYVPDYFLFITRKNKKNIKQKEKEKNNY